MGSYVASLFRTTAMSARYVGCVVTHRAFSSRVGQDDVDAEDGSSDALVAPHNIVRTPYGTDKPNIVAEVLHRNGVVVVEDKTPTRDIRAAFKGLLVGPGCPTLRKFGDIGAHEVHIEVDIIDGKAVIKDEYVPKTSPLRRPHIQHAIRSRFGSHLQLIGQARSSAAAFGRMAVITYINPTKALVETRRDMHVDRGYSMMIRKGGVPGAPLSIKMDKPKKVEFRVDVSESQRLAVVLDNPHGRHGVNFRLPPGAVAYTVTTELMTKAQRDNYKKKGPKYNTLHDFDPPVFYEGEPVKE